MECRASGPRSYWYPEQARGDGEGIRAEADDYVIDSLRQLEAELERISNQVRNGIRTVEEEQARRAPSSTAQSAE